MNIQSITISRKKRELYIADYEYKLEDSSTDASTEEKHGLRYVQQGIVSFGEMKECGRGSRPGIYTNVYHYLKWILDNARSDGE